MMPSLSPARISVVIASPPPDRSGIILDADDVMDATSLRTLGLGGTRPAPENVP